MTLIIGDNIFNYVKIQLDYLAVSNSTNRMKR